MRSVYNTTIEADLWSARRTQLTILVSGIGLLYQAVGRDPARENI